MESRDPTQQELPAHDSCLVHSHKTPQLRLHFLSTFVLDSVDYVLKGLLDAYYTIPNAELGVPTLWNLALVSR